MQPGHPVQSNTSTRPIPSPGFPWHWVFAVAALIAGGFGAWTLWGRMPAAIPLPTTGGTSGEIIQIKDVVDAAQPQLLQHRQVQFVGRFKAESTVVLEGRNMAGRSGLYVLTPLIERGNTGLAVLVQRGWVPSGTPNLEQRLQTFTPRHDLVIDGRLAMPDSGAAASAGERGLFRKGLSLESFAAETGVPLAPMVVLQEFETTTSAQDIHNDFLKRRWPELYPQDKNIARNGWAALVLAVGLALLGLLVWRKRKSGERITTEQDWPSTI
jgi:cytochrome oxidase assembly protein ShyY1